jgi:hypothetical protein
VEAVRRFRRLSAALAAVLTLVLAGAGYFFEPAIGLGVLLGGVAGIATFWMLALRVEQFAQTQPEKLQSATFRWALMRLVVYAFALGLAFQLDDKQHGFIAAALGIFIIRFAAIFLGATGLDQPREGK